jgi:hypothetical protein
MSCPSPTNSSGERDCVLFHHYGCPDGFQPDPENPSQGYLCVPIALKPATRSMVRVSPQRLRAVLDSMPKASEDTVERLHRVATQVPHPAVLMRLADHEETLHKLSRALDTWRTLLSLEPKWLAVEPDAKVRAHEAVARLEAALSALVITTPPDAQDVEIALGQMNVTPAALADGLVMAPGDYLLAVTAKGRFPWVENVHLEAGKRVVRHLSFQPPPSELYSDDFGANEVGAWRLLREVPGANIDVRHGEGCKTGQRCIEAQLPPRAQLTIAYPSPFLTEDFGELTFWIRASKSSRVGVAVSNGSTSCQAAVVQTSADWAPGRVDLRPCTGGHASGITFFNYTEGSGFVIWLDEVFLTRAPVKAAESSIGI